MPTGRRIGLLAAVLEDRRVAVEEGVAAAPLGRLDDDVVRISLAGRNRMGLFGHVDLL